MVGNEILTIKLEELRAKLSAEKRTYTLAELSALCPEDQNTLAKEFAKQEKATKDSANAMKAVLHDEALLLVALQKRAEQNSVTVEALFKLIAGTKNNPNTHALTLKKSFEVFVSRGFFTESVWRKTKAAILELAVRVSNKVTTPGTLEKIAGIIGDCGEDKVKTASLKAMLPAEPEDVDEVIKSLLETAKTDSTVTPKVQAAFPDGRVAPALAEIETLKKDVLTLSARNPFEMIECLAMNTGEMAALAALKELIKSAEEMVDVRMVEVAAPAVVETAAEAVAA